MNAYVFDVEADGLLDDATRIHCLAYHNTSDGSSGHFTSLSDMGEFLLNADVLIGHNITRYDIPLLEKFCGVKFKGILVDTLPVSWYLYPQRVVHGLESWGDDLGIAKPVIKDWKNLTVEEYVHRCSTDVKINLKLWNKMRQYLVRIYGDWEKAKKLLEYLAFKMDCAQEQERSRWRIDRAYAENSLRKLTEAREGKLATLVASMPSIPVYAHRRRPEKPFKKDGTLSVAGAKWFALLRAHKLPEEFTGTVEELISEEPPNPSSVKQVKDWLFALGWKPATFKFVKEEDGTLRRIPQIKSEHGPELCPSVLHLADDSPAIKELDSLGVINHRISIIAGFLDFAKEGDYIAAQIQGLTNTLRFKHKTAVNLPKVDRPYGEEIRGALIAEEGWELCGSDMSSLEDRLKQHFIYPYDPAYVKEMSTDDYDPHLSLALLAKEATPKQVEDYKSGVSKAIKGIRNIFKSGNYACQYGAGPPRLALTANISLAKAEMVWKTYWEKNWAIKKVAEEQIVKTVSGQMWLYNPISTLWYSLRYDKDKFSTLIQGTAAYVFDEWVKQFRSVRPQLTAQFHDEVVIQVRQGHREQAKKLLFDAIDIVNKRLNLNRELGIDVQFGSRYSEIH